jgi:F0F1-type ATP synthase assembly protein I
MRRFSGLRNPSLRAGARGESIPAKPERGRSVSKRRGGLGGRSPEMARGLSLAFEFAGAVFLFWLLGWLLDNWLGTEPWFQVVGSLIGWAGGFLHVYYATKSPRQRPGVPAKVDRRGKSTPGGTGLPSKDEETSRETDT